MACLGHGAVHSTGDDFSGEREHWPGCILRIRTGGFLRSLDGSLFSSPPAFGYQNASPTFPTWFTGVLNGKLNVSAARACN